MRAAIVDAGPLVAFLDRAERNHRWVIARIEELDPPLLLCEPVLAEAMHLLARFTGAQNALFGLLENGALRVAFSVDEHIVALRKLHQKYRDRPMSLADACIVRMAEIYEQHAVLTLDSDFSVYRKHGLVPRLSIFARIHGPEDIREESTEVRICTVWRGSVCRFPDNDDCVKCDALSSRRIVRHRTPLSAVF